MANREQIEKLMVKVRRLRDEAEADASLARNRLVNVAAGLTALAEIDADELRAAADTFAGALVRLNLQEEFARELRELLM